MNEPTDTPADSPGGVHVPAGQSRIEEHWGLGVSSIDCKVTTLDGGGELFILENIFHKKGGPARHLHYDQEEWFYALEGQFQFEVGDQRYTLLPGDSLLAPRRVPHVWAHVGDVRGRILVAFRPAGKMEAFFREVTKADAMPAQDPALWHAYGMELLGPPLPVAP